MQNNQSESELTTLEVKGSVAEGIGAEKDLGLAEHKEHSFIFNCDAGGGCFSFNFLKKNKC
jgi:hypothetical protein